MSLQSAEYESELTQKNAEIVTIKAQCDQLMIAVDGAASIQSHPLKRQDVKHQHAVANLNRQIKQHPEDIARRCTKNKNLAQALTKRNMEDVEEMTTKYEESNAQHVKTIQEM